MSMKQFSSISWFLTAGALLGCSASTSTLGEVGDGNGGQGGALPGEGGSGGASGDGSGGTIPTGGGTGPIETGGSSSGGSAGNMCGLQTFNLERKPAEVLLLLDRSYSMDDPPEEYIREDGTPETARNGIWSSPRCSRCWRRPTRW